MNWTFLLLNITTQISHFTSECDHCLTDFPPHKKVSWKSHTCVFKGFTRNWYHLINTFWVKVLVVHCLTDQIHSKVKLCQLLFIWKQFKFSVERRTISLVYLKITSTHIQSTWLMRHLLVYFKPTLADELVIKLYRRPLLISRNITTIQI